MSRLFAWTLAAFIAGISPARAAVVSVPLSAVPVSAPIFSAAASVAVPALSPTLPVAALSPALALTAAPLAASAPSLTAALVPAALPALPRAAAPALPALHAAADAPETPAQNPDAPKSNEEQAAQSAARFDGEAPAKPDAVAVPETKPQPLGAGLTVADPADEAWLARVVLAMSHSKTARRVLRDIAALARKRGSPTLVVIKKISNNGEFRYDSDLLVMDAGHRKRDPVQSAPIMAHELQHVLQRSLELPVDVQELEIESYTVENRVWSELHVEPDKRTFARQARARLLKDPDEFFTWLNGQYEENRMLHGGTVDAYVAWLREKTPKIDRRIANAEKNLRAAQRVVAKMRAEGKTEDAVKSFIQDDVEPVERRLRDLGVEKAWNERDLKLLSTPEGRARFRKYSDGVIRRARALSRSASGI